MKPILVKILRSLVSKRPFVWAKKIGHANRIHWSVRINIQSELGAFNYVGRHSSLDNVKMGSFCSIGTNVQIGPGMHPLNNVSTNTLLMPQTGQPKPLVSKNTHIGDDVWIGTNAVVMQGVKVGQGAVIGSNAVVTRDVPAYAIVAGIPAKLLRFRFNPDRIKTLLESELYSDPRLEIVKRKIQNTSNDC